MDRGLFIEMKMAGISGRHLRRKSLEIQRHVPVEEREEYEEVDTACADSCGSEGKRAYIWTSF